MPETGRFRAVLWDNDGVLVDTERLYYEATRDVMAGAGVDLDLATFARFFLRSGQGAWHLVAERGHSEEAIQRFRAERDRLHSELLGRPGLAIEGAREVVAALRGQVVQAVVTSAWREHFELAHRATGLVPYFDFVLTREDYVRSKPDPEPYLLALERAGLGPDECLVVEDTERGLAAAKAAGLTCWVIPTELTRGGDFGAADRVLGDLREVAVALLGYI